MARTTPRIAVAIVAAVAVILTMSACAPAGKSDIIKQVDEIEARGLTNVVFDGSVTGFSTNSGSNHYWASYGDCRVSVYFTPDGGFKGEVPNKVGTTWYVSDISAIALAVNTQFDYCNAR